MEEKTFFEYGDVKVTNTRFMTGAQTFAMSNVTSVKNRVQKPNRFGGILLLIVGLLIALGGGAGVVVGLVIAVVAGAFLYSQRTIYHVMLTTAGGESSALQTSRLDYITKVVKALNDAIVFRG